MAKERARAPARGLQTVLAGPSIAVRVARCGKASHGQSFFACMRVVSWNVNGLRSIVRKGFFDWLEHANADVVALQETRCDAAQVPAPIRALAERGWHAHFVHAKRAGYSGVGLLSRRPFDRVETSLGVRAFDDEGRVQIATLGALTIANVYFPNGSGPARDNSRVPFKLRFYRKLRTLLEPARATGARVLVVGDFNTAPHEIDLARPKENERTSGFLPEERRELHRWLAGGWVDTFRVFEPGPGHYTWWSQRFGVRERNVGWRLDLVLASPGAMPFVRAAAIHAQVRGSDHCPVSVDLDDAVIAVGANDLGRLERDATGPRGSSLDAAIRSQ